MKLLRVLLLACLAVPLLASVCVADDCDEWIMKGLSPDQAIIACTECINSGRWTGKDQAIKYNNRGWAWYLKEQYGKAIADYTKAIKHSPKFADPYFMRGIAWKKKGQLNKAIADFNKAIEINPRDAVAYNNRGIAWAAKGQYDKAIADYTKAIEILPIHANAYNNRAEAYLHKGRLQEALADAKKGVELVPGSRLCQDTLKRVQEEMAKTK